MSLIFDINNIKNNIAEIKILCEKMEYTIDKFNKSESKDYEDVMDMEMLHNRMEENLDRIKRTINELEQYCDE